VGLYLVFMVINGIYGNNRGMPDIVALLIFISIAFSGAPGPHPPMTMSIGERLRWVWSA
jgi:hypothetical protein